MSVEYLDWDGERCGYATTSVAIPFFEGIQRVLSLPAYPLSFSLDAEAVRARIRARGRRFEELRGYHFRSCVGTKILLNTEEAEERRVSHLPTLRTRENVGEVSNITAVSVQVSGRVVIDAHAYYTSKNMNKPALSPLHPTNKSGKAEKKTKKAVPRPPPPPPPPKYKGEEDAERSGPEMVVAKTANKPPERVETLDSLTDLECLLAMSWVMGLDLKTKEWGMYPSADFPYFPMCSWS